MTQPNPLIDDSSYIAIIESTLASVGLSELDSVVEQLGRTGAGQDQIALELQNTAAWKARFAGNQGRIAAGLAPLDPATYVATEASYRQILNDLPAGFYDSKTDIDNLIANNVSPSELSDKVAMANQIYLGAPDVQAAYHQYYGAAGVGGAIAAILDPTKAEPLIQQQVLAAQIGGTALSQGLDLTKQSTALKAAQQGVTLDQARQAYQQIAARVGADRAASARFAAPGAGLITQDTEEQALLLGNAGALKQQSLVASEESAQFGGHGASSTAANSLGGI